MVAVFSQRLIDHCLEHWRQIRSEVKDAWNRGVHMFVGQRHGRIRFKGRAAGQQKKEDNP